jgi:hypothetical protein
LRPIVVARTADEVRANVDSTVIEPAALDSPVAFWSGFAHGVAAFLVEDGSPLLKAADTPSSQMEGLGDNGNG